MLGDSEFHVFIHQFFKTCVHRILLMDRTKGCSTGLNCVRKVHIMAAAKIKLF